MESTKMQAVASQETISKFQINVASLYKERKKILQQINDKSKQRKILSDPQQKPSLPQSSVPQSSKSETQLLDRPRKLLKTDSQQKIQQHKPEQQPQSKPQQPKVLPKAISQRNRRVFGGLTSYLKRAGEDLQSNKEKEKEQHAKEVLNKVISKEKQEREEVESRQRKELDTQIDKLKNQKKENEEKLNQAENELLSFIVKSHFNAIGNFFVTKTQPKIFWRPKKAFQDQQKAQKLKSLSEKYVKRQQQEFQTKIDSYKQVFEHNSYMNQNERQYYSNYAKNLFIDHKNFIITKCEPQIFWKPSKTFPGMDNMMNETRQILEQKSKLIASQNEEFYKTNVKNTEDDHNEELQVYGEDQQDNKAD